MNEVCIRLKKFKLTKMNCTSFLTIFNSERNFNAKRQECNQTNESTFELKKTEN
jgi:hypothetical protein